MRIEVDNENGARATVTGPHHDEGGVPDPRPFRVVCRLDDARRTYDFHTIEQAAGFAVSFCNEALS